MAGAGSRGRGKGGFGVSDAHADPVQQEFDRLIAKVDGRRRAAAFLRDLEAIRDDDSLSPGERIAHVLGALVIHGKRRP